MAALLGQTVKWTREHRAATKNTLGRCLWNIRTIYVAERTAGGYIRERKPMRRKGWYRLIRRRWTYRTMRRTLVHELVHYRFPELDHGSRFEERIKEVLRGNRFEPKHIHLFAAYSKARTDESPSVIPLKSYMQQ
jgi:hypothetical protein